MLKASIITLLYLLLLGCAFAGENITHLTLKDGLPNSTVYYSMQDSKGFIWFCTETGVSRYDGKRFENFTINDGLADNEIFKCFEDSGHRLWFLSYNGKLSFYKDGQFYNSDNAPYLSYPLSGAFLLQCIEDKWHNIWFSTSFDYVIKVGNKSITQFKPLYINGTHGDYYITAVLFRENDSVKKFFVDPVTRNLYIQNLNDGKSRNIGKFPAIYQGEKKTTGMEFSLAEGNLFINGSDLISYDRNKQWHVFDMEKFSIKSIALSFLQDGHYLWLATDENGVFKVDLETGKLAMTLLQGELVTRIIKDSEQNVWFVTHDNGVFVLKNNSQLFTTVNTQNTFSVREVSCNSRKYLVSGNNNGTIYVSSEGKFVKSFTLSDRKFNRVLDIIPTNGTKIIIGCDGGIYEYDLTSQQKTDRTNYLKGYKNYSLAPDSSTWFCSQSSIVKLKDDKYTVISRHTTAEKYTAIAAISDSLYYVGTSNKLYLANLEGKQVRAIIDYNQLKTQVTCLKMVNGYLWAATHGNGIFIIKDNKIVHHITMAKDGIVSDICQKLHDDNAKYVWIATNEGISVLGRDDFRLVSNINADVGIASNDIKNIATDSEYCYAATSAGTCIFKLPEVRVKSNPPRVYVTGYKNGNLSIIDPPAKIQFNYFKGFIVLSFTAITFQSAYNLKYEYKFEDDSEWHRTPVTDIPLFSLNPGLHNLLFRAKKYNSDWSSPVMLSIFVTPLWYQTTLFKVTIGLIVLLAAYGAILMRIKTVRKQEGEANEYNRKINELESKALISQMNPHFIFNSLNTVQQLILVKEEEQSLNFLSDFSMLIRKMLENSRKQLIPLNEEIDFLKRYLLLESIRFNNSFDYDITIDKNLPVDDIKIPPVLIQPLLENAIKYGISSIAYRGRLKLSLGKEVEFLVITVEDNGTGIYSHQAKASSYGSKKESTALKVLEERLKLIKNDKGESSTIIIIDKGAQGADTSGTIIEIRIPILT